ncbi:putative NADPH-dependent methylglyoxal reductase GRP2 [Candida viswanathii]|uniref:Putative NADPH-dependent methylglyoxal reductase GRP2 n=1 Tax=Candida viswanathii TaxID=5486 RepID=A0A367XLD0_9ASCO|nr:putative NADPH-dependent methylglyoxal reductase GRP2 [Candida viswanathii]
MSSQETVFVTGSTGFIAQHIVIDLLKAGYKVVGTVRSPSKGDELIKDLKSNGYPGENFSYEVVPDIQPEGAFDNALKAHPEVTVFLHTASPFTFNVTDIKKELLAPAVDGTVNALKAVAAHAPGVKRVVVTSSIGAVQTWGRLERPEDTYDEDTWNRINEKQALEDTLSGYVASKKFAEQAAWEFVEKNKVNFALSVINPGAVFGPQAFPITNATQLNTSSQVINGILKLKPEDEVPQGAGVYIDVRDVAKAHLVAFEKEEAKGKRLLVVAGPYSDQAILNIIREDFKTLDLILPVGDPEKGKLPKKAEKWNNERTRKILGFEFIELQKTIHDSVQLILADSLPN